MINGKVIGFSLMIFFGGTAAVALLGYPYYTYSYREYSYFNPYTFVITSDEPSWNETSDRTFTSQIGITDLETNGTAVDVLIIASNDEIVLCLSNVTKISNVTVTCYIAGQSTVIVERTDGDAEVALTVVVIEVIPPPPTAIASPFPNILFWSLVAIIGFVMLILVKGESRWVGLWGRRLHFLIVFLVLLNIILTAPYIAGSLDGSFVPIEQTETINSGSQTFVLDSGSPTDYLEIGRGIESVNYSIRSGLQINPEMIYRMVIQDSHGSSLLEASFVNSTNWLIEGTTTGGAYHTLLLERIDRDVEIELSYLETQTVIRPDVDPTLSTLQAFAGGAVLFLALLLGLIMEPEGKPSNLVKSEYE